MGIALVVPEQDVELGVQRLDEVVFQQRRLEAQAPVAERLARLEAQADATRQSLNRIEAKLERSR
ncbi:MAG: hypothetical protein ACLGIY_03055 [Betaproteobacteria bacterium]